MNKYKRTQLNINLYGVSELIQYNIQAYEFLEGIINTRLLIKNITEKTWNVFRYVEMSKPGSAKSIAVKLTQPL